MKVSTYEITVLAIDISFNFTFVDDVLVSIFHNGKSKTKLNAIGVELGQTFDTIYDGFEKIEENHHIGLIVIKQLEWERIINE